MSNEWIKISERKPTQKDLPVFVVNATGYGKGPVVELWRDELLTDGAFKHLSLWMPANIPPLPKEDTQEEKDAELIKQVEEAYSKDNTLYGRDTLIALAIDFERSEIRQLLKRHQCGELPAPEVIREISRRVKL